MGVGGTVKTVMAEEGVSAFWKGINAAWLRESSYTSLRLGLYEVREGWERSDSISTIKSPPPFPPLYLTILCLSPSLLALPLLPERLALR